MMRGNLFTTTGLALALLAAHLTVPAPGARHEHPTSANRAPTAPRPAARELRFARAVDVALRASLALSAVVRVANGG